MILLSGTSVKEKILIDLKKLILDKNLSAKLMILQVGGNPESNVYIKQKEKFGLEIGVEVQVRKFPLDVKEEYLLDEIEKLNLDINVNGIIVQLPLPKNLNQKTVLNKIDCKKDVDGLGVVQNGLLLSDGDKKFVPATAKGIMSLLDYYDIEFSGKNVVVVGRSNLVGKPTSLLCLKKDATVTICHTKTKNLSDITTKADILIVACGVPKMINEDFVSAGQVIIDVGIHRTDTGLCGDVDFESVKDIVNSITPVPGGVGPLTVASLFQNVVDSAESL